jgi:hypothetical protein
MEFAGNALEAAGMEVMDVPIVIDQAVSTAVVMVSVGGAVAVENVVIAEAQDTGKN